MMNIILQNGNYALIDRGHEYVVACGFNGNEWAHGHYYTHWNKSEIEKAKCLQDALECFKTETETNYISRYRLEELATKFKDGFFAMCAESEIAEEYFYDHDFELTESEKEWFGIETESEDE